MRDENRISDTKVTYPSARTSKAELPSLLGFQTKATLQNCPPKSSCTPDTNARNKLLIRYKSPKLSFASQIMPRNRFK